MKREQFEALLLQSLEHEQGGVKVYTAALACVEHPKLEKEWQGYLEQTRAHVARLETLCQSLRIDPKRQDPGREVVRLVGDALVRAMEVARAAGNPLAAQIVAAECVVLAETKDHLDWELIGKCAKELEGAEGESACEVAEDIEDEEDEHLYHSKGWCRELWLESLGLP